MLRRATQYVQELQAIVVDRKNKRPFRPAPLATCRRQRLLARGDGSVFSALSVTRSSGAQQGVAWLCSSLALRLRARRGVAQGFPGARASGRPAGERLEGTIAHGMSRCTEVQYPVAARTAPTSPRVTLWV